MSRIPIALVAALLVAGCGHSPPPSPPPPAPAAGAAMPAPDTVWTARDSVELRGDSRGYWLPRAFTRLEVVGADSTTLLVRCALCADGAGGRVARSQVIHEPLPIESLAAASHAELALALRAAAVAHDLDTLYPLMSRDFSFSSLGASGRDLAVASWRSENFRTLERLPELLDRGISRLGDLWVAPPEYATQYEYRPLRTGFRRSEAGRWEWVFLVRGELEN